VGADPVRRLTGRRAATGGVREILADRPVRVVIFTVFVVMVGFGIIVPVLPLFARSFGVGYGAAGIMVSAFSFSRLAADFAAGVIVDRRGERKSAAGGLVFVALFAFATSRAPNFPVAVALWGIGGAGSAIVFAALYSYMLKVVPKHRMARTLGIFYGAFNVGVVAGSPLGGVIAHRFGLASPLFVYAVLLVIAAVMFMRLVPDPAGRAPDESATPSAILGTRATIARLLHTPGFITTIVANLAYLWAIAAVYDTLVPLFGRDVLGMSTLGIGGVFAVALATEFFVLYPAGAVADHRGRKTVMVPALAALAIMTVAIGWAPTPMVFVGLMALLGITSGAAGLPPAAMLSDVVPESSTGTAVGVFRFCGDLGMTLGPLVAGFAANAVGFKGAFALVAIPSVVALALVAGTRETLRSNESTEGTASPRD